MSPLNDPVILHGCKGEGLSVWLASPGVTFSLVPKNRTLVAFYRRWGESVSKVNVVERLELACSAC